jgi:hypothetical protein
LRNPKAETPSTLAEAETLEVEADSYWPPSECLTDAEAEAPGCQAEAEAENYYLQTALPSDPAVAEARRAEAESF